MTYNGYTSRGRKPLSLMSRPSAARKIQGAYRRKRAPCSCVINRVPVRRSRGTQSVGNRMMSQRVGRWSQLARDHDTIIGKLQDFKGFDIKFPTGKAPTDALLLNVVFDNNLRQRNFIKVGGLRVQAIIENCSEFLIEMNYMVVQNTRPDPAQVWDDLDKDFWILHGSQTDNSPDFLSQQTVWDPSMHFNKIRQDKFKILMHTKKTLKPQANRYAENATGLITHSTGSGPIQWTATGNVATDEDNVLRVDRYLQMNKMMSFEKPEDEKPYFPLHVLMWATIRQPALFPSAKADPAFCYNGRETLFWSEN